MSGELVTECAWGLCDSGMGVVETHWRITPLSVMSWPICACCAEASREQDRRQEERHGFRHLHLPIVQPVVGSEAAVCLEIALHAACRLLRICAGTAESEQTLAVLRAAQEAAYERVHGKEAA